MLVTRGQESVTNDLVIRKQCFFACTATPFGYDWRTLDEGMVMNDKMRAEFEVWAVWNGFQVRTDGASYYHHETSKAWEAWRGSRAALVVELPFVTQSHYIDKGSLLVALAAIHSCRTAIQSAGVNVK
jgi:hypothetical protein